MKYGFNERLRHVAASDALMKRQRRLILANVNGALMSRLIEEECRSNDHVVETAGSNRVLRASAPQQGVSLPDVQGRGEYRATRHTNGRHVNKAPTEILAMSGGNRVEDAIILGRLDDGFARKSAAPDTRCEDNMAHAMQHGLEGVPLRNVAEDDLHIRTNGLTSRGWIPRENPDGDLPLPKSASGE